MKFFVASNINMYIALGLSILNGVALCFAAYKFFQIIQLTGYKVKGYFLWLRDTKAKYIFRITMLSFLSATASCVVNVLFQKFNSNFLFTYLGLIFYFFLTVVFIINLYSAPKKVPLKNTARMSRLNVFFGFVVATLTFFIIAFFYHIIPMPYTPYAFSFLTLTPLLLPILVPIVHLMLVPLENAITGRYLFEAKLRLKKRPDLIKIGITGSYGKTSTKYMLNSILSKKYNVCMTPHSFNTLIGVSKVVNDYLKPENQVLIIEMGARNVGDIKDLVEFTNPKYAIITNIGSQHMLSFGSIENIEKTKYELIEGLPEDGYAVFFGENEGAYRLYQKCPVRKDVVGNVKESRIKVSRVRVGKKGTTFNLNIDGKDEHFSTHLVGKHNVNNLLLCVDMALELGLSVEEIKSAIEDLKPVPHRLELKENQNGITILDDSYNASVEGVEAALEVLSKFESNRIVVTPGLVELGKIEKEENFKFGEKIAKVADICIIVNRVNLESIKAGLESAKFDMTKVYCVDTLKEAKSKLQEIVKANDTVLFENDLPDNYI